jgi:hypothetical protein
LGCCATVGTARCHIVLCGQSLERVQVLVLQCLPLGSERSGSCVQERVDHGFSHYPQVGDGMGSGRQRSPITLEPVGVAVTELWVQRAWWRCSVSSRASRWVFAGSGHSSNICSSPLSVSSWAYQSSSRCCLIGLTQTLIGPTRWSAPKQEHSMITTPNVSRSASRSVLP